MTAYYQRLTCIAAILLSVFLSSEAKQHPTGKIFGHIQLDESWARVIYLSHIATYDDMYSISGETIISKTEIDSLGYFKFDIGFLPERDNLFRLHVTKTGDVPASLVIGGNDENHLFLIANRNSTIAIQVNSSQPPFRKVVFTGSEQNTGFQKITALFNTADSIGSISGASKRNFIENKLYEELLFIADSSKNPLVSLYAIYKGNFESKLVSKSDYYAAYIKKWEKENSPYFTAFRKRAGIQPASSNALISILIIAGATFISGLLIGKRWLRKTNKIEKLSAQERKVFELLKQGATNQEISDQYHIEISTVKSHVSNILSKLNMKSRKEAMNSQ
jgi:DNA-binding CsgD family transcriptional regulator